MAEVLAAHARGEALMPLRSMVPFEGAAGFMGLMPAWRGGADPVFSLKSLCHRCPATRRAGSTPTRGP